MVKAVIVFLLNEITFLKLSSIAMFETALVYMIDNWLTALNNDEFIGVVMLDYSKAFDLCQYTNVAIIQLNGLNPILLTKHKL